jgi:Immunoglobulin-like domain of bacterial spore germination/Sporulation and spore germination
MFFLVIGCAAPEAPAPSVPETPAPAVPAPTVTEAPPPSQESPSTTREPERVRNISIGNVEVANPLVVTGTARTFENNVVLRARASDGSLITETFTTATGEMGQHSPYRATLWLTRDPGPRVIVEALEYSARDGAEQSLVRVERPFNVETIEARLFLPDKDCTRVNPVTRRIPKSISHARLLVEALIADRATPFPKGSRVESINLRDGTLTVDFNERLRNVGGSCAAQMIRASVTETLRALPNVKKVVITAAGSEALALQP